MHRVMLKVSVSLLFISIIIYACGEYTKVVKAVEKYHKLEKKAAALLVRQSEKERNLNSRSDNKDNIRKLFNFREQNFLGVKDMPPPSDSKVGAGIMVELNSQKILWGKNVLDKVPIASLTKVLTAIVVMEQVAKRDDVTLDTKIPISSTARSTQHSSFLRNHPAREVPVRELLQSALLKSANDSCQLLAEFFGKTDASRFVAMMNAKASALKMKNSRFYNPHGLPGTYFVPETADNSSTMGDLMFLLLEVWEKHKEFFKWTAKRSMQLPPGHKRAVTINNTNPLVSIRGVIGLKTGYTNNAGWCLMTVYKDSSKVLFSIVTGCPTKDDRNSFCRALLIWGVKAAEKL